MTLNKFEGHKPFMKGITDHYPDKYDLQYYEFEEPKPIDLVDMSNGEPFTKKIPPLVFGINSRPEEFTKYDFLWSPDGGAFVVHDRVLKVLNEVCPDDFQAFYMEIKNLKPKVKPFINKEFHILNLTHRIEALDMEKSEYEIDEDGIFWIDKRVYKEEDCWNGHLLAREKLDENILFHPSLAKKFRRSKGVKFLTDQEALC